MNGDLFELGTQVGYGGQATVFVCKRLLTGHTYAAKVITNSKLSGEDSKRKLAALRREINIMRDLHHPRIVNLHDAFWEGGDCIIVMDLARDGNLYEKLEAEVTACRGAAFQGLGADERASKHVARQLLDGIGYMHAHEVLHRDLKLENILIERSYMDVKAPCQVHDIKIADFGLSRSMHRPGGFAPGMTAVGTPAYVAPEVLDEQYDERIDFWSFGVVLYAMLCGCMPFNVRSMNPEKHKREVAQVIQGESWRIVSPEGQAFVCGLLAVRPDDRAGLVDCLGHPWLTSAGGSRASNSEVDEMIRKELSMPVQATLGAVSSISGWTHRVVNGLQLKSRSSISTKHGMQDIGKAYSCSLAPEELITAVMQDTYGDGGLGSALVFYTTKCRIIAVNGTDARSRTRFVAPRGRQVMGLQFDGPRLVGLHLERAGPEEEASLEEIRGCVGSAVDKVEFLLRDGSVYEYGNSGGGGTECGPFHLRRDEYVVIVEQFYKGWELGGSIAFYTSAGNIIKLAGVTSSKARRFCVAAGQQICGVAFDKAGRLVKVQTCPENADLSRMSEQDVLSS